MAYYLVHARAKPELKEELRARLVNSEFRSMRPFGLALTKGLDNARVDPATGDVVWEEEDYCSPPLAMERAAVLDRYFDNIRVETVSEDEGWRRIQDLPSWWQPTE